MANVLLNLFGLIAIILFSYPRRRAGWEAEAPQSDWLFIHWDDNWPLCI